MQIRDRIKDLRRVKAAELLPNPKNWRRHPKAQADALRGILAEVGYADALLARELPNGKLILVDGHLRAETTPASMVPVLVLDVTEEEADKILLTLDPLAAMAEADDKAAELKAKWGTETGQLWQIGPNRLLCADCREKPPWRGCGGTASASAWSGPMRPTESTTPGKTST